MKYEQAIKIASVIWHRLFHYCENDRCFIAGSLRRKKQDVGDIEIVCQPKITVLKDMFDYDEGQIVNLEFQKTVASLGKIIKGNPEGRMVQIELPEGIMLDLFMPQPHDFFRQFAIRTGSAEYSQSVIATGWRKQGWVGTSDGLRKENECIEKKREGQSSTWICSITHPTLPISWNNEQEFFEWLRVPYLSPEKRN